MARHETLVDDRLDGASPSLRFRLTPWSGPFDEQEALPGAVLELAPSTDDPEIDVRIWLDPLAEGPTEQRTAPASGITEHWVDALLVEFVERVLRRS